MAKQEGAAPNSVHEKLSGVENWLAGLYKNLPALPEGLRRWLANNAYWLALIGGLLGLLSAWGMWQVLQQTENVLISMYTYGVAYGQDYRVAIWVTLITTVVQSVLLLMAYNGLRAQSKKGWNMLFYVGLLSVVTIVAYLLTATYGVGNAIGSLIGMAISFYFLFQIRGYFTK